MKTGQIPLYKGTQNYFDTLRFIDGIYRQCVLIYFDSTKCSEINVHLAHVQNQINNRKW